jgi:hypothetical protein
MSEEHLVSGLAGKSQTRVGWLLSPSEFAADCLATLQKPDLRSWAIGLHMPDEVVRIMESELVPKGSIMGLFTSPQGALFPVVALQAGALQLRILLSLSDDRFQDWFRQVLTAGEVMLAMEVPETKQVAVLATTCTKYPRHEIEGYINHCADLDSSKYLLDAVGIAEFLAETDSMPSTIPGFEVQSVMLHLVASDIGRLATVTNSTRRNEVMH